MGRPLLDHYHNALLTFGVTGHTRRALQDDYRRSVLTRMAPPLQAAVQIPPVSRWNNQGRILLAEDFLKGRGLALFCSCF
jgi:hypothetical protein